VWPHFQGGFGQYFYLRPNHAVFKLPDEITDEMAAGINCAFTQVYAGLDLAALRAGQTVVIQGAGGLGVYACAVAREMGAGRVIVIDGVDERLALARQFGADETVDLREHPTPDARVARVRALTDDWGGDVVMELVGNPGVVDEGLRMTAPEGTYVEIGNINVGWKAEFDPAWIIFGNRRILGLSHYEAEHLRGALELMRRTRTRYPWDRVVSHKFPLEAINEARLTRRPSGAAVDGNGGAADDPRVGPDQEQDHARDLLGLHPSAVVGAGIVAAVGRGVDDARENGVGGDVAVAQLGGEGLGELEHGALGRGVGGQVRGRLGGRARADVDD
jgi:Zn-dependent alcohol dehydrogenase